MKSIRTRFAPSPTGYLHVGGLRTALYAYLLAKQSNGQFLLRIEDTDQTRLVPGATENIIRTLGWAGINFDEGPGKPGVCDTYIQSERLPIYQKYAQELIAAGHAYYCFCSSDRLEQVRATQIAHKLPPAYDKVCRALTPEEVSHKRASQDNYVIRMKIPAEGDIVCHDLIRGDVTFQWKVVDDQVLIKSDGFPTYHLAVVVDDHLMKITHVIRGEEWLSSTPKHLLLYHYFGWQAPQFAHLPLLLNPDRSKLSKRQGDVAVEDYRSQGYLPEALINFIAFLGWNPGDTREIFSLEELVKEFSLSHVGKAGAVFNREKLDWLNSQYLQRLPAATIAQRLQPFISHDLLANNNPELLLRAIDALKERVIVLPDVIRTGDYFFQAPTEYDQELAKKMWKPESATIVSGVLEAIAQCSPFDAATLEGAIRKYAESHKLSMGSIIMPLRFALSNKNQGPSVYQIMEILGKDEVMRRVTRQVR